MLQEKKSLNTRESRKPRAHQLMAGRASTLGPLCDQLDASFSSSDDSFCLQMQVKSTQAETRFTAPQHLVTNLAYKLKPHRKTQYLRAQLDTCSNINIMQVSVYRTIFHDADCQKLAPSSKEIKTYTTDKIPVRGSYRLLVVHSDTQSLEEVTFQVTSQEGSVVLSCVTTLELGLIQPHSDLEDSIPASASLISSTANYPWKNRSKVSKPKKNVSSNMEQSLELLPA